MRPAAGLLLAVLFTGCAGQETSVQESKTSHPERILVAREVITQDEDRPRAEAVAIRDGRIVQVGSRDEIRALAGPDTDIDDLGDAVIIPGLVDAHGHVLGLGLALQRVDLRGCASFDELIRRVKERAGELPPGTWIQGRGWDQTLWPDRRFPHHHRLTEAVPHHPVVVNRVDGHAVLASGPALAAAGIDARTPDPAGGRIVRDAAGKATGVLVDNAVALVEKVVPPPGREIRLAALEKALHHLAGKGLTGVHDAGVGAPPSGDGPPEAGWAVVDLYRELVQEDRLPIRVYVMLGGNGVDPPPGGSFFSRPPILGEGDGKLTVRALKLGVDGALGSRGAALEEDYADEPGNRGLVTRDQESLDGLVAEAMRGGWQVAIHAIGDRGNRMALDAFERALESVEGGADTRPRIEHAQVLRAEDLHRFVDLGVIASVQPTHATSDSRWAGRRVGPQRIEHAYVYKTLLDRGARLACGSDFPVEDADPLAGLQAAVARTGADGKPEGGWRMQESLTPAEALACFTTGAAWAGFTEDETGRIRPGMRADLTILDGSPLAADAGRLVDLSVVETIVGGRTVYTAR